MQHSQFEGEESAVDKLIEESAATNDTVKTDVVNNTVLPGVERELVVKPKIHYMADNNTGIQHDSNPSGTAPESESESTL